MNGKDPQPEKVQCSNGNPLANGISRHPSSLIAIESTGSSECGERKMVATHNVNQHVNGYESKFETQKTTDLVILVF